MKRALIENGFIIDPANNIEDYFNILIENGIIVELFKNKGRVTLEGDLEIIDAKDRIVIPGMVDLHAHLREPGFEYKETIATGTMSAAAGGFTSVACMANTNPVNDSASVSDFIIKKAVQEGYINVYPVGAATKNLEGKLLAPFGELKRAGVVAVSDDGSPIMDSNLMRRALEYAKTFDLLLISHCEDLRLSLSGVMNEGYVSTTLGLRGIPNEAEDIMVARDLLLSRLTGGRLHIAHVSTEGAVNLIREAKSRGLNVTAEVAPHHFSLTHEDVADFNTNAKVKPPLRGKRDVEAIKEGLADGTIDAIATDHAPHASHEKDVEFEDASFGLVGFETALPLSLGLYYSGALTLAQVIKKLTFSPASILNIDKGTLSPGKDADITIVDVNKKNIIDVNRFFSKGKNTPFDGMALKGKAVLTLVRGRRVFSES
ncbi:MAG: dihydroorotase [Thermodesulfobacteriota bacterium]|nr:dihydroorotase [Thermodesulfobacteriota bacterium]